MSGPITFSRKLRVLDTHQLVTIKPPPLDWLADGVWTRGKLTLFGGREKRGKSLLQLAFAVCMASGGGDIAGIPVKAGRVLLIDAENGQDEIHRRLRAMGLAAEHADNLTIAEARGFELREDLDQIETLARAHRPDVVLLDSFRALWRGDERDEAQVAEALDPVRELAHDTDTAYSLTHHLPKHGASEYRGSTAIGACVEWGLVLERFDDDPEKATRRRLSNPLARFAPERDDRWLSIRSEGDDGPVTLAATEPYERQWEAPVRDDIEAAMLAFIREGCGGVNVSNGYPGDTLTPPAWSGADLARAVGRKPNDQSARRAIQRLADRGVLHRNGDQRWSPSPTLFEDGEDE